MSPERFLVDPTSETGHTRREPLSRPASLENLTVGLLDISKPRGDLFLDRLSEHLKKSGVAVRRFRKPTFARTAPKELYQQIASSSDIVIEALAD